MKYIVTFFAITFSTVFYSQNISSISPQQAVEYIVGEGIEVSNVIFFGEPEQLSLITNAPNELGISDGIILSTNKRSYLTSSEANETVYHNIGSYGSDQDLNQLLGGIQQRSTAYLQFDFIATSSELKFDFVFASNEYPNYNCCQYNDAFGFFLNTWGQIDHENIALVPGTNDPITINTVNNGVPGGACSSPIYCGTTIHTGQFNDNTWNKYGGSTKLINVNRSIQCQQKYTIKIAICNAVDPSRNSAVIIKQNSFTSNFNLGPITSNIQPICEGQDLTLTTTGSDGYTYTWTDNNGSVVNQGVDLKQITLPANTVNSNYSVSITNPEGCTLTQDIDVVVHSQNNNSPNINGINNSGEYTAYVIAGQQICFDIPSFDDSPEQVVMNWNSGINGSQFTTGGSPFKTGTFCWTPTENQVGWHSFDVTVSDNNICDAKSKTYTFRIKVICSWKLLCVDYENRTPTNSPLPEYTEMGECIKAGLTETTIVGNSNVTFEAPEIDLGIHFDGNPPFFDAIINENTSINGCENCCDNFTGFTLDLPLPNVFTPNGDNVNEYWFVADVDNPQCAFNAKGFELYIVDRWGITVYSQVNNTDQLDPYCCPYRAPNTTNTDSHSSIFWNGQANQNVNHSWWQNTFEGANDINAGDLVSSDVYFYKLTLYGCGTSQVYDGFIYVNPLSGMVLEDTPSLMNTKESRTFLASLSEEETKEALSPLRIQVYPNPVEKNLFFKSSVVNCHITITDQLGKIVYIKADLNKFETIDMSSLASGKYTALVNAPNGENRVISIFKK